MKIQKTSNNLINLLCIVSISLLSIQGCSDRDVAWDPSDLIPATDAAVDPDARTDFECQVELLQEDFLHCGTCDNKCDYYSSDQCSDGVCGCGGGEACEAGTRCVEGQCYEPDPGEVCVADTDCPSFRGNCVEGRCQTVNCREFDAECPENYVCVESQCTAIKCVPEVCDGRDNDCDGEADATNGQPLAEFCFSGPDITNISSPCEKGIRICENAKWSECMGEIPPVEEQGLLGCDGIDNNCDGCVDGILTDNMCLSAEPKGFDVVFAIDLSGSMSSYIEAVKMATDTFASTYTSNPNFRFGIVGIPFLNGNGGVTVRHDLSDFQSFQTRLSTLETLLIAEEPQWDTVYELATGEIPMSWTPGSTRIIIVYSDERAQTYRADSGKNPVNEQTMCDSLMHGEVLVAVTQPEFAEDYDDCGFTFSLSKESVIITEQLRTVISDPCSL